MATMSHPWNQQDGETAIWYGRFHDHYLVLGSERTVDAAYRHWRAHTGANPTNSDQKKRAPGQWRSASVALQWVERAAAWDANERRKVAQARDRKIEEMIQRHGVALAAAFNVIMRRLVTLTPEDLEDPRFRNVLAWFKDIMQAERVHYGQPIETQKHEHTGPNGGPIATYVTQFKPSPEELERVVKLWAAHAPLDPGDDADADPDSSVPHSGESPPEALDVAS